MVQLIVTTILILIALAAFLFPQEKLGDALEPVLEPGGEVIKPLDAKAEIQTEQDALFQKYGEYVQVTKDGRALTKDGEVQEVGVTAKVPANTEIHVISGSRGKGYQIIETTDTQVIHTGYGIDAEEMTYTVDKPTDI